MLVSNKIMTNVVLLLAKLRTGRPEQREIEISSCHRAKRLLLHNYVL